MEHLAEIIQDRLSKVKSLEERAILRDVLYDVFFNLAQESDKKYEALKCRIERENDSLIEKFYIYTSLKPRNKIDAKSNFLHPVLLSDVEEPSIELVKISQELMQTGKAALFKAFMRCDARIIKEMMEKEGGYDGKIKTDKATYNIKVYLKQNRTYIQAIEKLYQVFQLNGIAWSTVNFPYAYKFLDVVLTKPPHIGQDETIRDVSIDFGMYEPYKEIDMVPVWNIKRITAPDKMFPMITKKAYKSAIMPAMDRTLYEHIVSLEDWGVQNGYLLDIGNKDCSYPERLPSDLVLVSHQWAQEEWKLLQIENPANGKNYPDSTQVVSNEKDLSFAGRYAAVRSLTLRTKAELNRLLQSYKELSRELRFEDVIILDHWDEAIDTLECNSFLADNIRSAEGKKIMLMMFNGDSSDYLIYEKMSFMTSEVQLLFPEYRCIGKLL